MHLSTALVPVLSPAKDGEWLLWPFDRNSRPIFSLVGSLLVPVGGGITVLLAGLAGFGFIIVLVSRLGWLASFGWTAPALIVAFSLFNSVVCFIL